MTPPNIETLPNFREAIGGTATREMLTALNARLLDPDLNASELDPTAKARLAALRTMVESQLRDQSYRGVHTELEALRKTLKVKVPSMTERALDAGSEGMRVVSDVAGMGMQVAGEVAGKGLEFGKKGVDTALETGKQFKDYARENPGTGLAVASGLGVAAVLLWQKLRSAGKKAKDATMEGGSRLWKWLKRGLVVAGGLFAFTKWQEAKAAISTAPSLANMPPEKAVPQLVSVLTKEFTAAKTEAAAKEKADTLNAPASPISIAKTNPQWLVIQREVNAKIESGLNRRKDADYTVYLEGGVKVIKKVAPPTAPSSHSAAPAATPPPAAGSTPPSGPSASLLSPSGKIESDLQAALNVQIPKNVNLMEGNYQLTLGEYPCTVSNKGLTINNRVVTIHASPVAAKNAGPWASVTNAIGTLVSKFLTVEWKSVVNTGSGLEITLLHPMTGKPLEPIKLDAKTAAEMIQTLGEGGTLKRNETQQDAKGKSQDYEVTLSLT